MVNKRLYIRKKKPERKTKTGKKNKNLDTPQNVNERTGEKRRRIGAQIDWGVLLLR